MSDRSASNRQAALPALFRALRSLTLPARRAGTQPVRPPPGRVQFSGQVCYSNSHPAPPTRLTAPASRVSKCPCVSAPSSPWPPGWSRRAARGRRKKPYTGAACATAVDDFFEEEVWAKVGVRSCLTCHHKGGDAEESKFVLLDPRKVRGRPATRPCGTTATPSPGWRRVKEKDQSRMLLKVVGGLDHGGDDVLKPDSAGYRILAEFVRRVNAPRPRTATSPRSTRRPPPFFDGRRDARRPPAAPARHPLAGRPAADRRRTRGRRARTA